MNQILIISPAPCGDGHDDPDYVICDFCSTWLEVGVDMFTRDKQTREIECEECYYKNLECEELSAKGQHNE